MFKTTDTSEKGLEDLIVAAMTGERDGAAVLLGVLIVTLKRAE